MKAIQTRESGRADYLLEAVVRVLAQHGFRKARNPVVQECAWPAFVGAKKSALVVECRCEPLYRSTPFRAVIGDAILKFQHTDFRGATRPRLLLAVMFDRRSAKAEGDLKHYAQHFEPKLDWLVMGADGHGALRLGGKDEAVERAPFRKPDHPVVSASPVGLFSSRNQWLFKLLLTLGLGRDYWGGPERRPRSIGELADVSGVSQPSVSQFVKRAEAAGFVRRVSDGFAVLNHRELLDDWGYALRQRPYRSVGVRPLYGVESEEKLLARLRAYCGSSPAIEAPVCVGSHLACHLLGVGRSNNRAVTLYVNRPLASVMSDLALIDEEGDAPPLRLIEPSFPLGVFGGCVAVQEVPVADLLQCYLDVKASPARGQEQAEYIYQRVLSKHFEGP